MGKALFSLPFFFLFPALLFGSVWNSNALGQKLSEKESLEKIGWERVEEEGKITLYHNGIVEKTRTEFFDGYEENTEEENTRFFFDENGNLIRKIVTSLNGSEEYNYFYSDSLLSSFTRSVDSVVVEKCEYLRTPEGVVLALIKNENPIYFTEDRVYEVIDGTLETFLFEEEEESSERVWGDDGSYKETKKENGETVEYSYDGNGRLVEKKGESFIITYSYDTSGSMSESTEENSDGTIKTEYVNGKVASISTYTTSSLLKSVRKPLSDGTYEETRYIDGVPRYVFHFDRDGERILEARGL
ncbi:MAG: hypothetical protein MSS69_11545 [Spirochaetales bacterium]|nr:hypothetical protein [Spirochaetales bacterium]